MLLVSIQKLAVISGVGVRNFYRKIGYELIGESEMMIKFLQVDDTSIRKQTIYIIIVIYILFGLSMMLIYNNNFSGNT